MSKDELRAKALDSALAAIGLLNADVVGRQFDAYRNKGHHPAEFVTEFADVFLTFLEDNTSKTNPSVKMHP